MKSEGWEYKLLEGGKNVGPEEYIESHEREHLIKTSTIKSQDEEY